MSKKATLIILSIFVVSACGKSSTTGGQNLGSEVESDTSKTSEIISYDSDFEVTTDSNIVIIDPLKQGEADDNIVVIEANDPENPSGKQGLTLSKDSKTLPYLWAANHEHQSVSKFNTDTQEEEGLYWVGINPSRTAVDLDGNAWVGGRDDGRLTKILWDSTSCPDRNTNGTIETSSVIGGVVTKINSQQDPFADECVVYSAVPNASRLSIRGLAVAPDGKMWIGYTGGGVQSINPKTFELGPFYPGDIVPVFAPGADDVLAATGENRAAGGIYGLVIDSHGFLYTSSFARQHMGVFDTKNEQWIGVYLKDGGCAYGIAVDAHNRVWYGGHPSCAGVGMYDPDQNKFFSFVVPATYTPTPKSTVQAEVLSRGAAGGHGSFHTTGVAVEPATGDVWVSFYKIGYTGRLVVNENDYSQSTWTMIGTCRQADNSFLPGVGSDLRGVGFDHRGAAWTLGLAADKVFKIDPLTNDRAASLPDGKSIGEGKHYTYSDFTGSSAFNFTAPRGYWDHSFKAPSECAIPVRIDIAAYVPTQTGIGTRIIAMDQAGTPKGDWVPTTAVDGFEYFEYPGQQPSASFDIKGRFPRDDEAEYDVEIRFTTTDRKVRPILHSLRVIWELDPKCVDPVV